MVFQVNANVSAMQVYANLGTHQVKAANSLAMISSGYKAAGAGDADAEAEAGCGGSDHADAADDATAGYAAGAVANDVDEGAHAEYDDVGEGGAYAHTCLTPPRRGGGAGPPS